MSTHDLKVSDLAFELQLLFLAAVIIKHTN